MKFAEEVKSIMEQECITQTELANRLGVSRQRVSAALKSDSFRAKTAAKWLNALNRKFEFTEGEQK